MSEKSRIAIIATVFGTIIGLLAFLFGDGILKKTVIDIALESSPNKTSYTVGDILDTSGMKLIVYYENGSSEIIDRGFSCSPTTFNNSGSQDITVSYKGKTTSFPVMVSVASPTPAISIRSIAVEENPNKTSYNVGETLNTSGLKLKVTYTDGKTETVTGDYICYPTTLNSAGMQDISVSYKGAKTLFSVSVSEASAAPSAPSASINSIAVEENPNKTSYNVGETLNTSGLKLKVTYTDGKTETVTSDYVCSPTTLGSVGSQVVTISYGGATTTFSVTVTAVSISSISIESVPDKTSYYVGETLNTAGLRLNALYSNGTTETITGGFSCSPTVLNNYGNQTITINYNNTSTTMSVFVDNPAITLSTYSESISKNCWDDSYWDPERSEPFWKISLPTASSTPGGSISWKIVAGSAYIRDNYIAAQQPGTIVARATYNYCGIPYSTDYTVDFSMYKVTTDINYLYNAPSKNASVLLNVPNNTRVEITSVSWDASVQASEGRYYIFGNTKYNGKTGWIVIS